MKKDTKAAVKIFALIGFVWLIIRLFEDRINELLNIPLILQIPLVMLIGWGGFFLLTNLACKFDK